MKKAIKLTPRLQSVFDEIPSGKALWDICCDHGYLGRKALHEGFEKVHFVDPVEGLMLRLQDELISEGFQVVEDSRWYKRFVLGEQVVHWHCCKGEDIPIQELEGTISIIGVGARTIQKMLEAWKAGMLRNEAIERILCGPHTEIEKFEGFLSDYPMKTKKHWKVLEKKRERLFYNLGS